MNNSLHPWYNVDLVLIHSNANPVQMVELNKILRLECWDRVRLLLNLFTTQANSVEAKLQVKLAKLNADKTIMREFANLQNRGERLGWGAGGRHALESNMKIIDRENRVQELHEEIGSSKAQFQLNEKKMNINEKCF